MRKRTVLVSAVIAASVVAPMADGLRIAPLARRDGVVVTYRDRSRTAVVAQPSGRLIAVHSLRRVRAGTRVTVQGIKWGTPISGIKWGIAPRGIKWGIKWGRNGSFQSGLRRRGTKRAVWTPVRGPVVKRFGRKALAVGTPGGVVVVRVAQRRGSEGLVGQHSLDAISLPPVGATVSLRVYFGPNDIKIGRNIRYLKPPVPGAELPFAGTVVSVDPVAKTVVLLDDQDKAYQVRVTVRLPQEFTIAPYAPGQELAVQGTLAPKGALAATLIGPNATFAQADDPNAVQILTTGDPACTTAVGETSCAGGAPGSTSPSTPDPAAGGPSPGTPSTGPSPPPPATTPPPPGGSGGGTPPPSDDGGTPPPGGSGGGTPPPTDPPCRPMKDPKRRDPRWHRRHHKHHQWCGPKPCRETRADDDDDDQDDQCGGADLDSRRKRTVRSISAVLR